MAEVELIGVPFYGYGRTGNQALAATALRDVGLVAAFGGHVVVAVDDVNLLAPSARRGGDTGPINEAALIVMTDALNDRVGRAVSNGRVPVVDGADCSKLLGTVSGVRHRLGDVGLVFVDGPPRAASVSVARRHVPVRELMVRVARSAAGAGFHAGRAEIVVGGLLSSRRSLARLGVARLEQRDVRPLRIDDCRHPGDRDIDRTVNQA